MSQIAISCEKIGKVYRIGEREPYTALRDVVSRWLAARAGFLSRQQPATRNGKREYVWALKDVSFEVRHGEVVGLIGRNGAGKSTLLKILARVTKPTEGHAEIHGRLGSLLEVGTGFHPELTGRENVFLSGAILGMSKSEIRRKFDEIVAFAEVEKFIDTPIRHYSSGMQMRLAFAVAAHLDPEILLVDEVLAVGDVEFQKKCLGKMEEVSHGGRTIIFISHNMGAISRLCHRVMLLQNGQVKINGPTAEAIAEYLAAASNSESEKCWNECHPGTGSGKIRLQAVRVLGPDGVPSGELDIRLPCQFEVEYNIQRTVSDLRIALRLVTSDGTVAFTTCDAQDSLWVGRPRRPGVYTSRCSVPGNFLNEGRYFLTVSADIPFVEVLFYEEHAVSFCIHQTGGHSGKYAERWPGVICPVLPWRVEFRNSVSAIGK
jgi:lipopolysaccharide transport system ATP-binding protein